MSQRFLETDADATREERLVEEGAGGVDRETVGRCIGHIVLEAVSPP